ncbi:acrylyl-CoA reductase family protein [Candidimonas nitroreducens]|uniref:Zinc-binding dehydrogenase n=1 Tax=Candidimonas nitroreducens TaxID=683354 RepID=A0A225M1S5_9BURK|nr:acryloyl-CoA reductase [Candidimonas nitroreducens]OWT55294.1 zinc-binding dehydrogenase [Candidimonas nitroreducens]
MKPTPSIPPFKAYRLHAAGAAPRAELVTLGIDELSAGDTIVRVAYASLNYKDALAAAGKGNIVRDYPRIGGIDLVGHVVSSPDPTLHEGCAVIVHGLGVGVDHDGGFSEYARVPAAWALPLPAGLSPIDAATLGVAGYTAALSLHWLEHCGLTPDAGEVAVSGATGGVASVAIDILSQRGYAVCAISGKPEAKDYLLGLGARRVMAYPDAATVKPLGSGLWAGAIDSVGGKTLAWLLSTTRNEGAVAAFGNAGGMALDITVFPFILRGVKLLGINGNSPMELRRNIWRKLAGAYRPRHLERMRRVIALEDIGGSLNDMLERRHSGRTVVRM